MLCASQSIHYEKDEFMKLSIKTLCFALAIWCPSIKTAAKPTINATKAICQAVISTPANYAQLEAFAKQGSDLNCNCLVRQRTQFISMTETIVSFYDPEISEQVLQNSFNKNSLIETTNVTPLYIALSKKDFGLLRVLMNHHLDLNQAFPNGLLPLEYVLYENKPELFSFLIQYGADPRLVNIACPFDVELTKKIIRLGANPMTIDVSCLSEKNKNFNEILALIPNLDEKNLTQSEVEVLFSKPDLLETLLKKGLNINQSFTNNFRNTKAQKNLLIYAIETQNKPVFDLLLKHGASVNAISSKGFTPIFYAIHTNNLPYVEALTKKGANLNSINPLNEQTPLGLSIDMGFEAITWFLLENGAMPYFSKLASQNLPLVKAINQNNPTLIRLIINYTDKTNLDITHYFDENMLLKNPDKVHFLLSIGLKNSNEFLQKAIQNNLSEMVSVLLQFNPNWQTANNAELPIIYQAFQNNNTIIAVQLIQNGIDINTTIKDQEPLLIQAIERNSYVLVYQLLQVGANPNTVNNEGATALQVAIKQQNMDIIKALIERKVGISCEDFLLAIEYQNVYILKLLHREIGSLDCEIDGKSLKYHARKLKPIMDIELYLDRNL